MWCAVLWASRCSSLSRFPTCVGGFARPIRSISLRSSCSLSYILIGVESGGAKRWLGYGEMSFQPTEMMKIALVLALARYYQWLPPNRVSWPHAVLPPLLMIGAPAILALDQPDLGTAALFGIVGAGLLFLAGVSWVYFVGAFVGVSSCCRISGSGCTLSEGAHPHLHRPRPRSARLRLSHILQSKIAIGSGGFTGKGYMQGTQTQLNFLPEKHTDFIFTMFSEEMGFIGAAVLLTLYLLALLFITYMALRCRSTFPRLVAAGMGLCLFAYVFINVAMVTGLVPVVGVPLPAGLLRGHLDADHDDRPRLRAQRPCQPRDPHQAGGARAVLVRLLRGSPLAVRPGHGKEGSARGSTLVGGHLR